MTDPVARGRLRRFLRWTGPARTGGIGRELHVEVLEPRILLSADLDFMVTTALGSHKHLTPLVDVSNTTPAAHLDAVVTPAAVVTNTWVGGASGNWDDGSNWSTGTRPDGSEKVVIKGKTTVTLGNEEAGSIALSGGVTLAGGSLTADGASTSNGTSLQGTSLALGGDLTLTGVTTLTSSSLSDSSGTILNRGTLRLAGPDSQTINGSLDNTDVIQVQGGSLTLGSAGASTTDVNEASGTIDLQSNANLYGLAFTNAGTIEKTSGTGGSLISNGFNNTGGTIHAEFGTIDLTGIMIDDAELDADADAAILIGTGTGHGTYEVSGRVDGSGTGTVTFENDTLNVGTASATFDFTPGLLTLADRAAVQGGTLTNTGDLTVLTRDPSLGAAEFGGTFDNRGTIHIEGPQYDNTSFDGPGLITNEVGGTLDLSDGTNISGGVEIDNAGVLALTSGSASITIPTLNLRVGGSVAVEGGTLTFSSGGTWDSQTFQLAAGTTLDLAGGTYAGTQSSTGKGTIDFMGGAIGTGGATFDFAPGVLTWTSGTLDATGGAFTNAGSMTLSGTDTKTLGGPDVNNTGTMTVAGSSLNTLYYIGAFYHYGVLNNSGTLSFLDDSGISNGAIDNSGTVVKSGGTGTTSVDIGYNATGGLLKVLSGTVSLAGGTLDDATFQTTTLADGTQTAVDLAGDEAFAGTVTGTGTGLVALTGHRTYTAGPDGATLDFAPGELRFQGGLIQGGTAGFTNLGTFTVDQASTQSQMIGAFINYGTFAIASVSAFDIYGGSTFTNQKGAVLDFQADGAIYGFEGVDQALINKGVIRKSAGTQSYLKLNGLQEAGGSFDIETGTLTLASNGLTGTFTGTGAGTIDFMGGSVGAQGATFDFAPGFLQLDGSLNATGTLTNIGSITVSGSGRNELGGTIDNAGTTIVQQAAYLGLDASYNTAFNNTGLFELQDGAILTNNFEVGAFFNNSGTVRKAEGSGTAALDPNNLTNSGTIEADAGTLQVSANGSGGIVSGGTLAAGTLEAKDGATIDIGAITVNAGALVLDGAGSTISDVTRLSSNTGSLTVTDGATLTTTGDLANSGTVTVGPGSTLTVGGNYSQGDSATLATSIGGTPASGDFGTLAVTGAAALAGTFAVSLTNGFGPTTGETYDPVSFASTTGAFTTTDLPPTLRAATGAELIALSTVSSGPDLATTAVNPVTTTAAPGQPVTVQFTVTNTGGTTATGPWTDSVYLSVDGALDQNAVLLGRVDHVGNVASGASYTGSLTAALPALTDGAYQIVALADSRDVVPDTNRADNLGASTTTLAVTTPTLTLGQAVSGTVASGQDAYYRIVAQPGSDVSLAATLKAAGDAQIYVASGRLPTTSSFDQTVTADAAQNLTLANTAGGDVYILVHGLDGAGAGTSFSLVASATPLSITKVISTAGGHDNTDTFIAVEGTRFTSATMLSLVAASGTHYAASNITHVSSTDIYGTFDLTKVPLGQYTVVATDGAASASGTSQFTVEAHVAGSDLSAVISQLNSPAKVGVGGSISVTVTLQNFGGAAATITGYRVDATATTVPFAELISPGNPVILAPNGGKQVLTANFTPVPAADGVVSGFTGTIEQATDSPLDLSAFSAALKPPTVSQEAWDAVFQNLEGAIGTTQASLYNVEQQDDLALQEATGSSVPPSASDAIELELVKASDALPTPVLDEATDISYPAPGLSLTFSRAFQTSIAGRLGDGRLGQGWVDNWDYAATANSADKIVTIREGTTALAFTINTDGSFTSSSGSTAALAETSGAYRLTGDNGAITQFNADGTLGYVQDGSGNRIAAGYTSGQMTSLTSQDGDRLTIAYNAQGRIASVTDPAGRVATYGYDATGHELTSVSTIQGTSTYTYGPSTTGATAYELASIDDPGGTHVFFSYDSQGRLGKEEGDGGANALTFAYGANNYRVTNAAGNSTTYFLDQAGDIVAAIDPLGHAAASTTNAIGEVTSLGEVGGGASTISYGPTKSGSATASVTDPSGGTTSLSFGSNGQLTAFTNQDGDVTNYGHDANGRVDAITYADGSTENISYAGDGSVAQSIDRDGTITSYAYDDRGLLLSRTIGGATTSYTYDARGNMLTATDASGTITMNYDGADRLTKVIDPDGRFLSYSYNAAGRRSGVVDQDGFTTNDAYDAQGRLSELTDGSGALVAKYTYDTVGNLVRQDNGNGTFTTTSYDADGDVASIVNHAPDGSVNSRFDYTYDRLGHVATMGTLAGTATYSYDGDGRLIGAKLPDETAITYSYDAAGNRTAVVDNGSRTTYTTDDLDEFITVGGAQQTYDAAGDLTSGSGGTFAYNALGQLTSVTNASGAWTYTYDALGNRSSETHDGVTTAFLVDPTGLGNVVAEYDSSGKLIASYTYGDGVTSRVSAGGADYYDFDAIGSTAGLSGASGTYVASYSYDPFGNLISSTGTVANRFQFDGAYGVQTNGSGLDYMRARNYDPSTGRFTQADPSGLAGGLNPYAFAVNNPVTHLDPSGLQAIAGEEDTLLDLEGSFAQARSAVQAQGEANAYYFGEAQATAEAQQEFNELLYGPGGGTFGTSEQFLNSLSVGVNQPLLNGEAVEGTQFSSDVLDATRNALSLETLGRQIEANEGALAEALEPTQSYNLVSGGLAEELEPETAAAAGAGLLGLYGLSTTGFATFALEAAIAATPAGLIIGAAVGGAYLGNYLYDLSLQSASSSSPGGSSSTKQVRPADPNFISGPTGVGAGQYISGGSSGTYFLAFTNEPTADAPARTVTVTEQLDPNLDLSTFQLGSFGFGGQTFEVPARLQDYTTRIDDRANAGVFVDFAAHLDTATRMLTVTYTSIDPTTLDDESDVSIGFLPPDKPDPIGLGFLNYTVASKSGLATGTTITAQASVVFDTNAPVATNAYVNTIDNTPPTSAVMVLPALSAPAFALSWSGSDGAGSGIKSYDIEVSEDGAAYTAFLTGTTATSATFTGVAGHHYSFYSVATDEVGFTETPPKTPDATTTIDTAPTAAAVTGAVASNGSAITLAASYTDPDTGEAHTVTIDTTGTKGTVVNKGDGTFGYDPNGAFGTLAAGATATDSFSYTVTDAEGLSSTATATVTVTGVGPAPVAVPDGPYAVTENGILHVAAAGGVLANDVGTALTATLVGQAAHGTVTLNVDGSFDYTPTGGYVGADSFTYAAGDGSLTSAPVVVSLKVQPAFQTNSLTLRVAANADGVDPQFTVSVDGVQIGGVYTTHADHKTGAYQDITLTGAFGPAPKQVTVTYLNDLKDGKPDPDRALYVNRIMIDGQTYLGFAGANPHGSEGKLYVDGSVTFNLAPPVENTITLRVAGDSDGTDPTFLVAVDGVRVGTVLSTGASHAEGQIQTLTLTGEFGPDPDQVVITYLNDKDVVGNPDPERALYIDSVTVNGTTVSGTEADNPQGTGGTLAEDGFATIALKPSATPTAAARRIMIMAGTPAPDFALSGDPDQDEPWQVGFLSTHGGVKNIDANARIVISQG